MLIAAMKNSDLVDLKAAIWSAGNGQSYLGASASFGPNRTISKNMEC